jgi:hypothetical protein
MCQRTGKLVEPFVHTKNTKLVVNIWKISFRLKGPKHEIFVAEFFLHIPSLYG